MALQAATGRHVGVDELRPDANGLKRLLLGIQIAGAVVGRATDAAVRSVDCPLAAPFSDRRWQTPYHSAPDVRYRVRAYRRV